MTRNIIIIIFNFVIVFELVIVIRGGDGSSSFYSTSPQEQQQQQQSIIGAKQDHVDMFGGFYSYIGNFIITRELIFLFGVIGFVLAWKMLVHVLFYSGGKRRRRIYNSADGVVLRDSFVDRLGEFSDLFFEAMRYYGNSEEEEEEEDDDMRTYYKGTETKTDG